MKKRYDEVLVVVVVLVVSFSFVTKQLKYSN